MSVLVVAQSRNGLRWLNRVGMLGTTSVEEIKNSLAALSPDERNQVSAYLLHLRNAADPEYQAEIAARLDDKDPSHWLTLEEFERRLNQR